MSYASGFIERERAHQDKKWGANRRLSNAMWLTIITEELGEVAKAMLEHDEPATLEEAIQVAAVAQAWVDNLLVSIREP